MRAPLKLSAVAVLFLAAVACLPLIERELAARQAAGAQRFAERYSLPPSALVRAMTFGYNELGADLIWIRTIAYFAEHLHSDRDLRHLMRYLDSILALDERFAAIYRYGPAMLIGASGERTEAETMAAIRLLERAVRVYPEEWRYPFYLGSYYMTELRSRNPRQRAAWRREGADWIRRAALLGADSPWLPSLAATVYTEQGQRNLAIRHLQELYVTTQDPAMKAQIAGKLKHLEATRFLEEARLAAETAVRERAASGLEFVPFDLFALLRLPPLRPFSLHEPPASGRDPGGRSSD